MDIREMLAAKNGSQERQKPKDSQRIAELEAENADLRSQVEEQADALVELAEMIVGGDA